MCCVDDSVVTCSEVCVDRGIDEQQGKQRCKGTNELDARLPESTKGYTKGLIFCESTEVCASKSGGVDSDPAIQPIRLE